MFHKNYGRRLSHEFRLGAGVGDAPIRVISGEGGVPTKFFGTVVNQPKRLTVKNTYDL